MNKQLIHHKTRLNEIAELGWQEAKTTEYLRKTISVRPEKIGFGPSKTGLLYRIGSGEKAILMRADIDALKTSSGPRHICGHSSHTAGLLQALIETIPLEAELTERNKSIYFLFQPAEETYPSGAAAFVKECPGIIGNISRAFASHVRPLANAGEISLQAGPVMARGDYFEIDIAGKMSHVKNPEQGIDAVEAGALLITAIKKYQKKHFLHLRIGVGIVQGGRQANTVADSCQLKGDIRLDSDLMQERVKADLEQFIRKTEKATGATITLRYFDGYPVLSNDKILIGEILPQIRKAGWEKITRKGAFSFGCEDFSFISNRIPSVFAFIGTGDRHDIHNENCTISDAGTENIYRYFKVLVHWWTGR